MINVAAIDRCGTARERANRVTDADKIGQVLRRAVGGSPAVKQRAAIRVHQQPAPGTGGICGDYARHTCSHRSVTGEEARLIIEAQQRACRYDHLNARRSPVVSRKSIQREATEDRVDKQVRPLLVARAGIIGGQQSGCGIQPGKQRGRVFRWEIGPKLAHAVLNGYVLDTSVRAGAGMTLLGGHRVRR